MTQREEMERDWKRANNRTLIRFLCAGILMIAIGIAGGAYLASCMIPQAPIDDLPPGSPGPDSPM